MGKQKIGIALAGRQPGYQIFARINWEGPDPEDYNKASVSLDNHYVGVRLKAEGDVYEHVICNFVSNEGRQEAFRIVMQLPHSYAILDAEGYPVSPTVVMEQVRSLLETSRVLELYGSSYRLSQRMMMADFPVAEIAALLDQFTIKPAWNPYITMESPESRPWFVDIPPSDIPLQVNALLHCGTLREASMVFFGRFQESAKPVYVFTPEELRWEPIVKVSVRCLDGSRRDEFLSNAPRTFDSSAYGYDLSCFRPCSCTLSVADVLRAYRTGAPLQGGSGVRFVLNVARSTVEIEFEPQPVEKVFYVRVARADNLETPAFGLTSLSTNIGRPSDRQSFGPVKETGYVMKGLEIPEFERFMHTPQASGTFRSLAPDFEVTAVTLIGEIIKVSVRYIKPEPKPEPRHEPAPEALSSGMTPMAKLILSAPVAEVAGPQYVRVSYTDMELRRTVQVSQLVNFTADPMAGFAKASMEVPSELTSRNSVEVSMGDSPRIITNATVSNGVLYANFHTGMRRSAFSRYLDLFTPRYSRYITPGYRVLRIVTVLIIALMLLLTGAFVGYIAVDGFKTGFFASDVEEIGTAIQMDMQDDSGEGSAENE